MNIETRFAGGDRVWHITRGKTRYWEPCAFCGSVGKIQGKDEVWTSCPKCYGKLGKYQYKDEESWHIVDGSPLTIGQVQLTHTFEWEGSSDEFDNYGRQEEKTEERYMCRETGIGSGTLYYSNRLCASEEEALAECTRRDKENISMY